MSTHAYTEDQLVEQPAKAGGPPSPWSSPSGRGSEGEGRVALGRETKGEVVLVSRSRAGLERRNPALPPEASLTDT